MKNSWPNSKDDYEDEVDYSDKEYAYRREEKLFLDVGKPDVSFHITNDMAKSPFIKKLDTPYVSGKGGAVALGFKNAEGDYIGFVDAQEPAGRKGFSKPFHC